MRSFIQACLASVAFAAGADYDNTEKGALWGAQGDDENSLCQTGREQSPIDLTNAVYQEGISIELSGYYTMDDLSYSDADFTATQTFSDFMQRTAEFTIVPPTGEDEGKGPYYPLQFHFHAPSENSIDGKLMDAEMHIVHTNDDGDLAVLAILFEESDETYNDFLAAFQYPSSDAQAPFQFLFNDFDLTRYWTFKGSLTTPPCTEGLRWTVLKQVQPISKGQLKWFTDKLADSENATVGSNRVVQPLYERVLYDSEAPLSTGDDEDEESEDEDGDAGDDFSVSLVGSAISAATVALLAF